MQGVFVDGNGVVRFRSDLIWDIMRNIVRSPVDAPVDDYDTLHVLTVTLWPSTVHPGDSVVVGCGKRLRLPPGGYHGEFFGGRHKLWPKPGMCQRCWEVQTDAGHSWVWVFSEAVVRSLEKRLAMIEKYE